MKQETDKIYVRVMRNGYIPQLGICGPIPNPIKVTRKIAHAMIVSGIDVYEVDPVTKGATKLTVTSVLDGKTPEKDKVTPPPTFKGQLYETKVAAPKEPITLNGVKKDNTTAPVEEKKPDETNTTTPSPVDDSKEDDKKANETTVETVDETKDNVTAPVEEKKDDEKQNTETKNDNKKENNTNKNSKK